MILSVPYDIPASEVIPEISRYGYQFVGWFSNQSLTEPVDTSQLKNISQTLYAGWRDVETDYFVATEGNDNNDGSFERPFKTFKKALSVMTPGDTLVVFGGTYHEQLFVNKSGTEDAWLRFKAYANDTVIIDGTGITTDSLSGLWYGMIRITDVNYISIDGFTVINSLVQPSLLQMGIIFLLPIIAQRIVKTREFLPGMLMICSSMATKLNRPACIPIQDWKTFLCDTINASPSAITSSIIAIALALMLRGVFKMPWSIIT